MDTYAWRIIAVIFIFYQSTNQSQIYLTKRILVSAWILILCNPSYSPGRFLWEFGCILWNLKHRCVCFFYKRCLQPYSFFTSYLWSYSQCIFKLTCYWIRYATKFPLQFPAFEILSNSSTSVRTVIKKTMNILPRLIWQLPMTSYTIQMLA